MVSNSNEINKLFREGKNLIDCYQWITNTFHQNLLLACVGEGEICRKDGPAGETIRRCCEEGLDCRHN